MKNDLQIKILKISMDQINSGLTNLFSKAGLTKIELEKVNKMLSLFNQLSLLVNDDLKFSEDERIDRDNIAYESKTPWEDIDNDEYNDEIREEEE